MPTARASLAAMDWACSIIAGSHDAAVRDGRREDRAIAVDDVEAEEDRDVEARFFDGDVLVAVDFFWIGDPEHGAGAAFFDDLLDFQAVGVGEELRDWEAGELRELGDFFVEGHLLEEVGGAGFYFEELNLFRCKNIVMFIDACRESIEGSKGISGIGSDTASSAKRAGIVTFFSCGPDDLSYEVEKYKHGSFTAGILDAIRGGEVATVADLNSYLEVRVPEINSSDHKPFQQPYVVVEPLEKQGLEIFFNPKVEQVWNERYTPLCEQLCRGTLQEDDADLWLNLVIFLDQMKLKRAKANAYDKALIMAVEKYLAGKLVATTLRTIFRRKPKAPCRCARFWRT